MSAHLVALVTGDSDAEEMSSSWSRLVSGMILNVFVGVELLLLSSGLTGDCGWLLSRSDSGMILNVIDWHVRRIDMDRVGGCSGFASDHFFHSARVSFRRFGIASPWS